MLEFLKTLFADGPLSYEQLENAASKAGLKVGDLSSGAYVAKDKLDSRVNALNQQISDLNNQIKQRDTDLTALNEKLTAAQTDASKLTDAQTALTALQSKYDKDTADYQQKLNSQAYDFALREASAGLKFSSNAAKRAFIEDANKKGLKLDDGKLLGWDDYVNGYRTNDPGAFVADAPADPSAGNPPGTPNIVLPSGAGKSSDAGGDAGLFHFNFAGVRPDPSAKQ